MLASPLKQFSLRAAILLAAATAALSSDIQIPASQSAAPPAEFQFVRLVYSDNSFARGRGEAWLTDFPDAERYLIGGLKRLTRIDVADEGNYMPIMDERLFDYPWIYAVEVGYWYLSDAEAARLRDYLLRGGMLVVDDFHGTQEWASFTDTMRRVFPDRPIVDIPLDDPIFHVAFDLVDRVQIPGIQSVYTGRNFERDGYEPHWRGIYDDDGHLMVVINHNMDLGDAWEHADVPEYALPYTTRAYQYAINYILYAMSH
jgi:hypothetical protein